MKEVKIDLTVLNKLTKEVNDLLLVANKIKEADSKNRSDYVVELSKLMGVCTSLALESSALSQDCLMDIKVNTTPEQDQIDLGLGSDYLETIFGKKTKN